MSLIGTVGLLALAASPARADVDVYAYTYSDPYQPPFIQAAPERISITTYGTVSPFNGSSRATAEADLALGLLQATGKTVNYGNPGGSARAGLDDVFTITTLPGFVPGSPVVGTVSMYVHVTRDIGRQAYSLDPNIANSSTWAAVIDNAALTLQEILPSGRTGASFSSTVYSYFIERYPAASVGGQSTQDGVHYETVTPPSSVYPYVNFPQAGGEANILADNWAAMEAELVVPFMVAPGNSFKLSAMVGTNAYSSDGRGSFASATNMLLDANGMAVSSPSINLPTGYAYTSASGVLLTAAVPEPAESAMLLAGLALLGLWGRWRNR